MTKKKLIENSQKRQPRKRRTKKQIPPMTKISPPNRKKMKKLRKTIKNTLHLIIKNCFQKNRFIKSTTLKHYNTCNPYFSKEKRQDNV